jgi:hypothetical protein
MTIIPISPKKVSSPIGQILSFWKITIDKARMPFKMACDHKLAIAVIPRVAVNL